MALPSYRPMDPMPGYRALDRHTLAERVCQAIGDEREPLVAKSVETDIGKVHANFDGHIRIVGRPDQTDCWATRPREAWPCSDLRGQTVRVTLYRGDLEDFEASDDEDVGGDELDAWMESALAAALEALS